MKNKYISLLFVVILITFLYGICKYPIKKKITQNQESVTVQNSSSDNLNLSTELNSFKKKYPYGLECRDDGLVKLELPHLRLLSSTEMAFFNKNHREMMILFALCHMYEALPDETAKRKISILIDIGDLSVFVDAKGKKKLASKIDKVSILHAMKKIFPKSQIVMNNITFVKNKDGYRIPKSPNSSILWCIYNESESGFYSIDTQIYIKGNPISIYVSPYFSDSIGYIFKKNQSELFISHIGGWCM